MFLLISSWLILKHTPEGSSEGPQNWLWPTRCPDCLFLLPVQPSITSCFLESLAPCFTVTQGSSTYMEPFVLKSSFIECLRQITNREIEAMVSWNGRTSERWKCEPHQGIIFLHRNLGNFIMSGLSSTKLDLKLLQNYCIVTTSDSKPGKYSLMEVQNVQCMISPSLERFQPDTPIHVTGRVHNDQKTILGWPLSKGMSLCCGRWKLTHIFSF